MTGVWLRGGFTVFRLEMAFDISSGLVLPTQIIQYLLYRELTELTVVDVHRPEHSTSSAGCRGICADSRCHPSLTAAACSGVNSRELSSG